jgi:hypothetical protein
MASDLSRLRAYTPRGYPSIAGGEARFLTEELQSIRNAIRGLVEQAKAQITPVAVADLPSAVDSGVGARRFVNNATATTFASTVAGGGANVVPVYSNGTDWKIG